MSNYHTPWRESVNFTSNLFWNSATRMYSKIFKVPLGLSLTSLMCSPGHIYLSKNLSHTGSCWILWNRSNVTAPHRGQIRFILPIQFLLFLQFKFLFNSTNQVVVEGFVHRAKKHVDGFKGFKCLIYFNFPFLYKH